MFGGAHDTGGMYRLVGGDHHKSLHLKFVCKIRQTFSAKHVVLDGLADILLHQWNMLVGRSVKDDIGAMCLEYLTYTWLVGNVANQSKNLRVRI